MVDGAGTVSEELADRVSGSNEHVRVYRHALLWFALYWTTSVVREILIHKPQYFGIKRVPHALNNELRMTINN